MIRKRGESCGIKFIDISRSDFGFIDGNFDIEMIGEFNGQETFGIDTFREMYNKMGFTKIVKFSKLPIIRNIFEYSYRVFASYIRPRLPKRKTNGKV